METTAILSSSFYAAILKQKENKREKYLITGTYLDEVIKGAVKAVEENDSEFVSIHSLFISSENEIVDKTMSDAKFWERAFQLRTSKEI